MANLTAVVYSSGTLAATVTGTVSTVDALLASGMPITQGGQSAAVKAASTAPAATDPALVVALSPNGINPNGQTSMAASAPVVIASNQSAIPVTVSSAAAVTLVAVPDPNNSSTATLASGATFTGTATDVTLYRNINVLVESDKNSAASGVNLEFSSDGSNWYDSLVTTYTAGSSAPNSGQIWGVGVRQKWFRVVYINTNSAQARFTLNTFLVPGNTGGDTVDLQSTALAANTHGVVTASAIYAQSGSNPIILQADTGSSLKTSGNAASGATDVGNPIKIGGVGRTTNPTAVTDGQRVDGIFDKLGKQVVVGSIRTLKGSAYASVATGAETTIVAGIASTFIDVYGCVAANNSATATQLTFKDSLAGTTKYVLYVPAGDTRGFMLPESAAFAQATVNLPWTVTCLPSVSAALITLMYNQNT